MDDGGRDEEHRDDERVWEAYEWRAWKRISDLQDPENSGLPMKYPDGTWRDPDGTVTYPNGMVEYPDGTVEWLDKLYPDPFEEYHRVFVEEQWRKYLRRE
jgi:hypothetical protein